MTLESWLQSESKRSEQNPLFDYEGASENLRID